MFRELQKTGKKNFPARGTPPASHCHRSSSRIHGRHLHILLLGSSSPMSTLAQSTPLPPSSSAAAWTLSCAHKQTHPIVSNSGRKRRIRNPPSQPVYRTVRFQAAALTHLIAAGFEPAVLLLNAAGWWLQPAAMRVSRIHVSRAPKNRKKKFSCPGDPTGQPLPPEF